MEKQDVPYSIRRDQYALEDEMYRMHMMGKSQREIAEALNVEVKAVDEFINKHFKGVS